jgi:hypothetical protein
MFTEEEEEDKEVALARAPVGEKRPSSKRRYKQRKYRL